MLFYDNPWKRKRRANAFIDSIDRKPKTLSEQPNMKRVRKEPGDGIRSFPVARFVIFYRSQTDGIKMVRVLHGAKDIEAGFHSDG
ncbi:MAG: type II toxin-antitoxin system RelE/ParE family toxin [Syntrophobacteraceae bacterium]